MRPDRPGPRPWPPTTARRSSAPRPATSTPAPSIPLARAGRRRARAPAPGCTSTARSGCGRAPADGRRHLVAGAERADSWATDAHKWLNVPYDCGLAFVRRPGGPPRRHGRRRPTTWRPTAGERDAVDWTPEFSRRARGFAVYAALRSLGRAGVAELVDRCCDLARRFAAAPRAPTASRCSTTSSSTRCWCASAPTSARDAVIARRAGRRQVLDERHDLARQGGHADLGGRLPHFGRRCRPHAGRRGRRDGRARPA